VIGCSGDVIKMEIAIIVVAVFELDIFINTVGGIFCMVVRILNVFHDVFFAADKNHWCIGAAAIFIIMGIMIVVCVICLLYFVGCIEIKRRRADATVCETKYFILLSTSSFFLVVFFEEEMVVNSIVLISRAAQIDSHELFIKHIIADAINVGMMVILL
jgi:hypothetical protein